MRAAWPTRRTALQSLGVALAAPAFAAFAQSSGKALNFLAVGDWGREGAFHQAEVAARMGETAAAVNARFVISVGDNFYEDGVAGVDDPQWKTSFDDVYSAPSLQVPWHVILGNHDYHGNAQAQIDYTARSRRWRLPARWRSLSETAPDGARVEFFLIDTSPFISSYYADGAKKVKVAGQDTAAQLAWLDAALGRSSADWKIVVGHHPIWPLRVDAAGEEGGAPKDMQAKVDPILRAHRVPLYLNGHDHDLQHVEKSGAHYVCTGAGSKTRKACEDDGGDFCSVESGFIACSVDRQSIRIVYRDYAGATLHVVEIPRGA
ncbi:MAG: metallophosphoesterase [Caulobacteraceae bacterium]|nr:metallophosphoesterase [Caulobacteraceae bacterium]